MDKTQLCRFTELLIENTGLRIPEEKEAYFASLLKAHSDSRGYGSLDDYRLFLISDEGRGDWQVLAQQLTIGETFFFRDHGQFDLLRWQILPELIANHQQDKTLRLWSAGCASGEEAYSLAMLIDSLLPDRRAWNILILGSDIDHQALAKAKQGCYGAWSFRLVPEVLRQRYFQSVHQQWQLNDEIRQMVTFRFINLVADSYPDGAINLQHMDLILCRNVFIYFTPSAIVNVASKLAATLTDDGYLMTAHTELIGHAVPELEAKLFAEGVVYQRRKSILVNHNLPTPVWPVLKQAIAAEPIASLPDASSDLLPLRVEPITEARRYADQGEYAEAHKWCQQILAIDPLAADAFFLLAQLAELKGDAEMAKAYLNKVIYLDVAYVAAYMQLAALYERVGDTLHAQRLRHAALNIVKSMPADQVIEQYEHTAGELALWLMQWEEEGVDNSLSQVFK